MMNRLSYNDGFGYNAKDNTLDKYYPLVNIQKTIEHCHLVRGFTEL